jgi:hypothetical protein
MRVASVALVAAFSLAACAPRIARRPSPPPKAGWVVYPEAEVKDAKNAHEYKGAALCQRCHASPGKLAKPEPDLCYDCHVAARMTHVGKIQKPLPPTLPYEEGGRIICHTCHDPHDVKAQPHGFRLPYRDECLECHRGH